MAVVKHSLIEHDQSFHADHWAIRLEEGDYAGVVYQYDTVSFEENEDNGDVVLTFNTITLDNPNEIDLSTEEFEGILGDILTRIIEEQLEAENENGINDTGASAQ
jgi:hypothetical protein